MPVKERIFRAGDDRFPTLYLCDGHPKAPKSAKRVFVAKLDFSSGGVEELIRKEEELRVRGVPKDGFDCLKKDGWVHLQPGDYLFLRDVKHKGASQDVVTAWVNDRGAMSTADMDNLRHAVNQAIGEVDEQGKTEIERHLEPVRKGGRNFTLTNSYEKQTNVLGPAVNLRHSRESFEMTRINWICKDVISAAVPFSIKATSNAPDEVKEHLQLNAELVNKVPLGNLENYGYTTSQLNIAASVPMEQRDVTLGDNMSKRFGSAHSDFWDNPAYFTNLLNVSPYDLEYEDQYELSRSFILLLGVFVALRVGDSLNFSGLFAHGSTPLYGPDTFRVFHVSYAPTSMTEGIARVAVGHCIKGEIVSKNTKKTPACGDDQNESDPGETSSTDTGLNPATRFVLGPETLDPLSKVVISKAGAYTRDGDLSMDHESQVTFVSRALLSNVVHILGQINPDVGVQVDMSKMLEAISFKKEDGERSILKSWKYSPGVSTRISQSGKVTVIDQTNEVHKARKKWLEYRSRMVQHSPFAIYTGMADTGPTKKLWPSIKGELKGRKQDQTTSKNPEPSSSRATQSSSEWKVQNRGNSSSKKRKHNYEKNEDEEDRKVKRTRRTYNENVDEQRNDSPSDANEVTDMTSMGDHATIEDPVTQLHLLPEVDPNTSHYKVTLAVFSPEALGKELDRFEKYYSSFTNSSSKYEDHTILHSKMYESITSGPNSVQMLAQASAIFNTMASLEIRHSTSKLLQALMQRNIMLANYSLWYWLDVVMTDAAREALGPNKNKHRNLWYFPILNQIHLMLFTRKPEKTLTFRLVEPDGVPQTPSSVPSVFTYKCPQLKIQLKDTERLNNTIAIFIDVLRSWVKLPNDADSHYRAMFIRSLLEHWPSEILYLPQTWKLYNSVRCNFFRECSGEPLYSDLDEMGRAFSNHLFSRMRPQETKVINRIGNIFLAVSKGDTSGNRQGEGLGSGKDIIQKFIMQAMELLEDSSLKETGNNLHKLMGNDPELYFPFREHHPSRIRIRDDSGPFSLDIARTKIGLFSVLIYRLILFRSEYLQNREESIVFSSVDDWKEAIESKEERYYFNEKAYGKNNRNRLRRPEIASTLWDQVQASQWDDDTWASRDKRIPFTQAYKFFKGFRACGSLMALLLSGDFYYAGVVDYPEVEGIAEAIYEINSGAVAGLEVVYQESLRGKSKKPQKQKIVEGLHYVRRAIEEVTTEAQKGKIIFDWFMVENTLCKLSRVFKTVNTRMCLL